VYADDDFLGVGEPVGTRIVNEGKEHVEEFRAWVEQVEEEGFTVNFEMI
jgi:rubrerythrin